jgi:predicted ribosome quality control (RQC) complex YloA/Tae2 family protein
MLQNYYTLLKLKQELSSIIGMKMIQCFSQKKDTITFDFFDGNKEFFLHFTNLPFSAALFIYDNMIRAKSNSVDLCSEVLGDYLQNIRVIEKERIIELQFIEHKIVCHIFGGGNANLFLCNKQNKILFALNNYQSIVGLDYREFEKSIINNSSIENNFTIIDYLTKSDFIFGKPYAMQFCYMNGLFENQGYLRTLSELSQVEKDKFNQKAIEFSDYLLTQNQYYILKNNNTKIFSLIPLTNYEIVRTFDSISSAIKYQCVQNIVERRKSEIKKELLPKLKRDERRILKAVDICNNIGESLERADKYRTFAELLMSQPNLKQRISEQIELKDWDSNNIVIPLDAKFTLLENANKYYNKSRKALEEASFREKRLPILKEKLEQIQNAIEIINSAEHISELEKIKKEFIKKSIVIMQTEKRFIDTKFRKFELSDGYTIFVGKNAANNDELTMKFAKPNDIWLHAKSVSGSHCVVRSNDGKLPKNILTKAAEIACFYSDARNSKYAPVVWTQKKYVRKPKGTKQGAVILQKETTIMVEPKEPEK